MADETSRTTAEAIEGILALVAAAPSEGRAVLSGIEREARTALARVQDPSGTPPRDLLSIVCHDMKDPLASIVMGAGFLKRVLPADDSSASARRVVDAIHRSADRMNRVIGDFHDLGKLEAGRVKLEVAPQDAGAIVRAAADAVAAVAKDKAIVVEPRIPETPTRVRADRTRVLQVLAKLLDNAVRATPANGTIAIAVEPRDGAARFSVSDTGRGIPAERKPTIFDRTVNATRTPRDGPGLGLAIAKGIVELHGGAIGVDDNAAGPGATFWFTLPIV